MRILAAHPVVEGRFWIGVGHAYLIAGALYAALAVATLFLLSL